VERINHPQKVLLIRHASTAMTGTLCGQLNPPLNALGREQATALAPLLRKWNVRRLYASDLQRAIQTAQPLAELWGIPIMARSDLREISFGTWEGKRWSEVRALTPDIAALESSFRHRVLRALSGIVAECDGQLTAIVTHLGVMRVIFNEFSSTNQASAPLRTIDHCSVFAIRVDGSVLEPLEEPTVCS
jgi:broad specificity phosphatase PhoE